MNRATDVRKKNPQRGNAEGELHGYKDIVVGCHDSIENIFCEFEGILEVFII